jgi:hypothetical protein
LTALRRDGGETANWLGAELARLTGLGPFDVLGVGLEADGPQVRAAFLAATKVFHPNRFALSDAETRELANEVFLLIRNAYELIADDERRKVWKNRTVTGQPATVPPVTAVPPPTRPPAQRRAVERTLPPMPRGGRRASQVMTARPEITARHVTSQPAAQPSSSSSRAMAPVLLRPTTVVPASGPMVKPAPSPAPTPPVATVASVATASPPASAPAPGPALAAGPAAVPAPAGGPRSATVRPRTNPTMPRMAPLAAAGQGPAAGRPLAPAELQSLVDQAQTRSVRIEMALNLLERREYRLAREALFQIAAEDPQNRKLRAQLHLAWGLEHRDDRQLEAALRELERAVVLDPECDAAAKALRQIAEQRKSGSLFSKIFGR